MIERALLLSGGWLAMSFLLTLIFGTRVKKGGQIRSALYLGGVLLIGAIPAALTFGVPSEVTALTVISYVIGLWWIRRLQYWNAMGQTLWVVTFDTTILYLIYSYSLTAFSSLHPLTFLLALNLTLIETVALLLGLTYAYEALDVTCRIYWGRRFDPKEPIPGYTPKVSLHVPAYNEPPEVVEATVRSLAQIDYPNFEVLVVDNNTPGEPQWRPLEKLCHDLGPRFRFLHLEEWPGYKSGALNFSMTQTARDAEIIGIIDADYLIAPEFLRELIPYFADSRVAFVQTPQNYRDYEGNPYLESCYYGYKYFFSVSMPARNERNAIIFAGTMGLLRKSVLQELGGWDEWCITEDAEASLRILKRNYQAIYVNKAYGTGLIPFSFDGLKKQRFRWCFGGIQILKKHWESLLPWSSWIDPDNRMTQAQRYYYLMGGLQWFGEPLNLCFTLFLIIGAIFHMSPSANIIRPLTGPLIVIPVIFLFTGIWRFLWVLRYALNLSFKDGLRAMGNFFSLGWTVTLGCVQGLVKPKGVFMRTSKSPSDSDFVRAVRATQWEAGIGVTCLVVAITANLIRPTLGSGFLGALLFWQASLYFTSVFYSLLSVHNLSPTDA